MGHSHPSRGRAQALTEEGAHLGQRCEELLRVTKQERQKQSGGFSSAPLRSAVRFTVLPGRVSQTNGLITPPMCFHRSLEKEQPVKIKKVKTSVEMAKDVLRQLYFCLKLSVLISETLQRKPSVSAEYLLYMIDLTTGIMP